MVQIQKRQTAVKIWISNLINGKYVKSPGEFESNYIEIKDNKIGRVNIIANVVFKFQSEDNKYISITLDDGSYQIRVKSWNEDTSLLKEISVGEMVSLIGKPREFNDEIYIVPEIVKKVDDYNWECARKLELLKLYGKPERVSFKTHLVQQESYDKVENKEDVVEEKIEDSEDRQKILKIITTIGGEGGVEIDEVVKQSNMDKEAAEEAIIDLLKNGEVYEPRPNIVRVL